MAALHLDFVIHARYLTGAKNIMTALSIKLLNAGRQKGAQHNSNPLFAHIFFVILIFDIYTFPE
jgi:hypothetical protein